MPEWMRSPFLAPVYALLISFGTALALGYAMSPAPTPPNTPTPGPQAPLTLRLVTVESSGDRVPATELQGAAVRVSEASSARNLEVGRDGSIALTPVNGQLTVCVWLPGGWTAPGTQPGPSGSRCVTTAETTGTVDVVVEEG